MFLLLLRVPAIVQPAGGDQGLYAYSAQRLLAGGVPYQAAWDQKPPGIAVVYAVLVGLWPHQSVVAIADLVAAAAIAWLLLVLGRRAGSVTSGWVAASVFLLLSHPSLTRLSGVYVRSQCETFIALLVAASVVVLCNEARRWPSLFIAGIGLGLAVWLKYNAVAYVLPLMVATAIWPRARGPKRMLREFGWIMTGVVLVTAVALTYFAVHGALTDLRLATIDYNLRYSTETYANPINAASYVVTLPVLRARVDLLWFLGGLGVILAVTARPVNPLTWVVVSWILAALVSIGVNGARDLPQYFVQASPALAAAAGLGLASLRTRPARHRYLVVAVILVGLWKIGDEPPAVGVLRLGGLPQLARNIQFDLAYLRGRLDRATYLARFGAGKFDAAATDEVIAYVKAQTTPADSVFVFGFSGGTIGAWSGRRSPTRFFWSRPVILEFAADRPGYGSAGLLRDLERDPPALVVLQKYDWRFGESLPNSAEFFQSTPALRAWLDAGYQPDRETAMFAIWKRRG